MCFAGDLLQCLAAANQDIPKELHDLASKDARFRKGLPRQRGGGRGGRGRGRKPQVGNRTCQRMTLF